jgi:hypothetical protein
MAVNIIWFPFPMDAEVIMITQKKLPYKRFLHHLILRSIVSSLNVWGVQRWLISTSSIFHCSGIKRVFKYDATTW